MLVIRLRRAGAKKNPHYRIVVTEARTPRESDFVESLGLYEPRANPARVVINHDRYAYWVSRGAQPSATVRVLVARHPAPPVTTATEATAS